MPTVPIPFNGGAFENVADFEVSDPSSAVLFLNLLLDDAGANVDRPGLLQFSQLGVTSPVIGLTYFVVSDTLVAVTEARRIYSITQAGAVTDITGSNVLDGASRPVFEDDGTNLAIAGGGVPQQWAGSGTCSAMPGSPVSCSHIAYLDGYWINFLLDDQELRLAGPTSVLRATWDSSDFFSAEGLPDNVVAIAVLLRELYAFGTASIETFQNVGDTSAPFQRTFFIDRGISAPYSVAEADNTLWFLDSKRNICYMNGRTPTVISTPYDKTIQKLSTVADCWSTRVDIEGYYALLFVFPSAGMVLVFDYKLKTFVGQWTGFSNGQITRHRIHSHVFVESWNQHFIGDYATGTIWQMSRDYKLDGADLIAKIRRTGGIDHGTDNKKRSNYYSFQIKRGVGTLGSDEPQMEVRFKDDGKPWSNPRAVGLGFPGDTRTSVRISNTGIYAKRQIEVRITDPVEVVLLKAEENVDVLLK